MEKGREIVPS